MLTPGTGLILTPHPVRKSSSAISIGLIFPLNMFFRMDASYHKGLTLPFTLIGNDNVQGVFLIHLLFGLFKVSVF